MKRSSRLKLCGCAMLNIAMAIGFSSLAPAAPKHSAATIDDTGSIFDESAGSPSEASPPVTPPANKKTPTNPVTPARPSNAKPPPTAPSTPTPVTPDAQIPVQPKVVEPAPVKPARPTKIPVPDGKARAASLKLVRELFEAEYTKTGAGEIHALALRLFDQSREAADDPTARYVLLSEASDRAAASGDAALAIRAIRVLARAYRIDGPAAALAALTSASKAKGATADAFSASARTALDFAREALAANDLATACAAADIAVAASVRGRDGGLAKVVKQNADRIADWRKGFEAVRDATARLKIGPNNPEDCLAVGKYSCFARSDWVTGLRLLSRGSDPSLKMLAAKDIAVRESASSTDIPIGSDEALQVADRWWEASEAETDPEVQKPLQTRACQWYARAASNMGGLERTRLENRISDVFAPRLQPGLVGHYYNSHRFDRSVMERVDPQINFAWGNGAPAPGVNPDGFAIWWGGYIKAPTLGRLKVTITADDACRIWLDGKLILDEWHQMGAPSFTIDVEFTGRPQRIVIEYGEVSGLAQMTLNWLPRGAKKVVPIPASAFFHDADPSQRMPMPRPQKTLTFGGHSYGIIYQDICWYAAKELCEQMGGHLLIVETAEEQKFINETVGDLQCWIGLSDDEEEGVWRWVNGHQPQFLGWIETEPQGGEVENFVITYHAGWADVGVRDLGCVCEWDD